MIDRALAVIKQQLNERLKSLFGQSNGDFVRLGPVVQSGTDSTASDPNEPITLTLVRIEEERTVRSQVATRQRNGQIENVQPQLKLNLYLLVSAHVSRQSTETAEKRYERALRYLSACIGFFQAKPVFLGENTPELDAELERLTCELMTLSFEEQNQLWGTLSARHLPAVLYRLRLVVIQESVPDKLIAPITDLGIEPVAT